MKKKISITLNEKILEDIDSMIDSIYVRNRSQAIEHLISNALGENKSAVILAGGPPEKLRIGKNEFRVSAQIGRDTVIERAVKKLRANNFKNIYFVAQPLVLHRVFEILKEGAKYGVKISYIEEKESRGSADSLRLLKGKINSNFLIVYSDIIFNKINIEELWNNHLKHGSTATLMLTTSKEPSKKGVVRMEGNKILNFSQKPKKSDIYLVFSPIIATSPEIFEYEGNSLEEDIFPALAERGLLQGHLSSEKERHIHSTRDLD